jgi:NifU-like protein involved in Fe-S cluster formation
MAQVLYTPEILRLATSIPHLERLAAPQGSAERRSPICGSRVTVDIVLDAQGRVAELGLAVSACALGQASAALMGRNALARSRLEASAARDALKAYLNEEADTPGDWPGLEVFAAARAYPARHAAILLPFDALNDAMTSVSQ